MFLYDMWKVTKGLVVEAKGVKVGTSYLCYGNTYSTLATTDIVNVGENTIDVARTYSNMSHHRM